MKGEINMKGVFAIIWCIFLLTKLIKYMNEDIKDHGICIWYNAFQLVAILGLVAVIIKNIIDLVF